MIKINIEEQQKAVFNFTGITPFTEEMTFYYDESGNCRKFSLSETGFNSTDAAKNNFVLAGVAHKGKSFDMDVPALYNALDYKEGQKELKFKNLYHNSPDFLSFIGSERATAFLKWLSKSGLYVHYSALNNLYYSLVDIVDSLSETHPQCIVLFGEIKSALYHFTIEHENEVVDILIKHTYPDVKNVSAFCEELCSLIRKYNDDSEYNSGFFLELLRQMLKTAGRLDKMVFVQNNEPFLLIEEYYHLYLSRCGIFSKSQHIFDEEITVQKQLSEFELYEDGVLLNNLEFVKSHENIGVQISDMLAGLLRNLFLFLDQKSIEEVISIGLSLNEKQVNNFIKIWTLVGKADEKSHLFIQNVNSPKNLQERNLKLQILGVANEQIRKEKFSYEL